MNGVQALYYLWVYNVIVLQSGVPCFLAKLEARKALTIVSTSPHRNIVVFGLSIG